MNISEFFNYVKDNGQEDQISKYFVEYAKEKSPEAYAELTLPKIKTPELNLQQSLTINSPALPKFIKSNIKQTPTQQPIQQPVVKQENVTPVTNTQSSSGGGTTFKSRQEFINAIAPAAKKVAAELGIDPNIIISQAIAEHGDGKTRNVRNANNIFNITAGSSWKGPVYVSEDKNEKGEIIKQKFRKYATIEESVRDWADLMKRRYGKSLDAARKSPEDFFRTHSQSGYATGVGATPQERWDKLYKHYKGTFKKYV